MKTIVLSLILLYCTMTNLNAIINGSKHDLSYTLDQPLVQDEGTLCVFCHTPHGSNSDYSGNTIWDETLSINETTYIVYNKEGVTVADEVNTNSSKACLSCHDGVSAVNSSFESMDMDSSFGSTNDSVHEASVFEKGHPISVEYNEERASLNPANGNFGAGTKGYSMTWNTPDGSQNISSVLRNNKVECSSCHDPHLGENQTFLRVKSNERSYLCRGCHAK